MPPRPHRPDALSWQVFRGSDAVRDGLLTEHQLRNSAWVRLRHDIYADARLERDHALACRAALLRLPPGVVVGGPSAAHLHGVLHAASFTDDVHVLVPRSLRVGPQRGLSVHVNALTRLTASETPEPAAPPPTTRRLPGTRRPSAAGHPPDAGRPPAAGQPPDASQPPDTRRPPAAGRPSSAGRPRDAARPMGAERPPAGGTSPRPTRQLFRPAASIRAGAIATARPGVGWTAASTLGSREQDVLIPRSDPGRAAWETAVWLDPVRAVAIVDSLLGQGLADRDTLAALAARNADRPGGRRARWVFDLADSGAESPPESHLRVRLVLGGLPRPVVQHPVRLPIGVVLHPDLAWPQYRVAVEYDGKWHSDAEQLHRDRRRLNLLVNAGWLVLHVTSRRLNREFPAVLREVRDALVSRGWRRGSPT